MQQIERAFVPGQGVMCLYSSGDFSLVRILSRTVGNHVVLYRFDDEAHPVSVTSSEPVTISINQRHPVTIELVRWEGFDPVLRFTSEEMELSFHSSTGA